MSNEELSRLEKQLFIEHLSLEQKQVLEAKRSLLGLFEVLYRIDERLKSKPL